MSVRFLSFLVFIISFSSFGQQAWQDRYKGDPRFKLSEDPRLRSQIQVVRGIERDQRINKEKLKANRKRKRELESFLSNLQPTITANKAKISENNKKIKEIELQLPGLKDERDQKVQKVVIKKEELKTAKQALADIIAKLQELEKKYEELKKKCETEKSKSCVEKLAKLEQKIKVNKEKKKNAKKTVDLKKNQLEKAEVAATKASEKYNKNVAKIPKLKQKNTKLKEENKKLLSQKSQKENKLRAVTSKIRSLETEKGQLQNQLARAEKHRKQIRRELINYILRSNQEGVRSASRHGSLDGSHLAEKRGNRYGLEHGRADGLNIGIQEGRAREYTAGEVKGNSDGEQKGKLDGRNQGEIDGAIAGNKKAATYEAEEKAFADASSSDAAQEGKREGAIAGKQRAISSGQSRGGEKGRNQSIKLNETSYLKKQTIKGPYAGAFSSEIPLFPSSFRGQRYKPNSHNISNDLAARAFVDGYNYEYQAAAQEAYLDIIEEVYLDRYNREFVRAKNEALSQYYQTDYDQGYSTKYTPAYNRKYKEHYAIHFEQKKKEFTRSPNRSSSEYKSTYQRVYDESYNADYSNIKKMAYDRYEQRTFDANIKAQTEKYRVISFNKTQNIYKTKPVLKFEKIEYQDGGVRGVAANDEIYQPSEKIIGTIVLKNFGKAPARNLKIKLLSGKTERVMVPPRTEVTLQSVVAATVPSSQGIGSSLKVKGSITLDGVTGVAARHFKGSSSHSLKDINSLLEVDYPVGISAPEFLSQVEIDQPNKLVSQLVQKGSRGYQGQLEIELISRGASSAEVRPFMSLSSLKGTQSIQGASVQVSLEDSLKEVDVYAVLKKNGVTLGQSKIKSAIIHAPYKDKGVLPVIAVQPSKDRNEALDLIAAIGGIDKISLLDLESVKNTKILKQTIDEKDIITLSVYTELSAIIEKSKKLGVILISDSTGIKEMKELTALKEKSLALRVRDKQVLVSEKVDTVIQKVDMSELNKALAFSKILKKSNIEMLEGFKRINNIRNLDGQEMFDAAHIIGVLQLKKLSSAYSLMSKSQKKSLLKNKLRNQSLLYVDVETSDDKKVAQLAFGFDAYEGIKEILSGNLGSLIHKDLKKAIKGGFLKGSVFKHLKKMGKALKRADKNLFEDIKDEAIVLTPKLELL